MVIKWPGLTEEEKTELIPTLSTMEWTTEVWISTRGRISEATRIAVQETLEEDNKKDLLRKGRPRGNT